MQLLCLVTVATDGQTLQAAAHTILEKRVIPVLCEDASALRELVLPSVVGTCFAVLHRERLKPAASDDALSAAIGDYKVYAYSILSIEVVRQR